MKEKAIKQFISQKRFQTYSSFEEYKENLHRSEKCYPLLSLVEISLRNSIDFYFQKKHSEQWLFSEILLDNEKRKLQKAQKQLQQKNEDIIHDKIIAELSFGFWTSLFSDRYHNIMRIRDIRDIRGIFPNLPPRKDDFIDRHRLYQRLNKIRIFRNRVFHYEKIIHKVEFDNIEDEIFKLLRYFDEEIYNLAKDLISK